MHAVAAAAAVPRRARSPAAKVRGTDIDFLAHPVGSEKRHETARAARVERKRFRSGFSETATHDPSFSAGTGGTPETNKKTSRLYRHRPEVRENRTSSEPRVGQWSIGQ